MRRNARYMSLQASAAAEPSSASDFQSCSDKALTCSEERGRKYNCAKTLYISARCESSSMLYRGDSPFVFSSIPCSSNLHDGSDRLRQPDRSAARTTTFSLSRSPITLPRKLRGPFAATPIRQPQTCSICGWRIGVAGNAYTFPASKPLQVKHHAWNGMREQIDETGCAQPHENANGQAADRSAYKTANVNGK